MWLNEKEIADFLEYWVEKFDKDFYYFVSFKYNEEIDEYISLNFNKKPTSQFRVLLEAYKLSGKNWLNDNSKYENIWDKFDKYLIKTANRSQDFDVFEWWGVFYNGGGNRFIVY
jgi:hypothetical protein